MMLIYSDEQAAIAGEARRALAAHTRPDALLALLEQQGQYDASCWTLMRDQGWTAAVLPTEHGGLGLSLVDLGLIAFEIGRVMAGAPFLTTSLGAARGIVRHGPAAVKADWLPRLASGDAIGAVAFAEGQDVLGLSTTLADGTISGNKQGVAGGLHADIAVVLAQEAGEPVLAAVPLAGVSRTYVAGFDNSRCLANLSFNGASATVLVRGVAALEAARDVLATQAVVTAHEQAGGAQALMERARDHALSRRAFGQQIGAFQSVKHRIAELYVLVELARAAALSAAVADGTPDFLTAAAAARLSATTAYETSARDTTQIHGGMGVTWEGGLHLHVRRARTLAMEQGSLLFWEDLLVDRLTGVGEGA
ncbi:MAG TPA: acyl-CoA dehydrogenase family protein [Sphingobium sp.]